MGRSGGSSREGKKYGAGSASGKPPQLPDGAKDTNPVQVGILIDGDPVARRPSRTGFDNQNQYGGYESRHAKAAEKIGKVARGGAARSKVADRYHMDHPRERGEEPHHPRDFGLGDYASRYDAMPEITDDMRYCVRDITARNVLLQLGCQPDKIGRHSDFEHDAFTALTTVTKDKEALPAGVRKQTEACRLFQYEIPAPPPEKVPATAASTPSSKTDGAVSSTSKIEAKAADSTKAVPDAVSKKYLLGKYECMAIPCRADFNSAFDQIQRPATASTSPPSKGEQSNAAAGAGPTNSPKPASTPSTTAGTLPEASTDCDGPDGFSGWFWVLHEGAPNIGENAQADDFPAYSREEIPEAMSNNVNTSNENASYEGLQGGRGQTDSARGHYCCWKDRPSGSLNRRLDEDMYLESMYHLWRLSLLAFARLGVEDGILFPFGMGAFLRHLGKNDDRYLEHPVMRLLRRRVADQLMKAIVSVYGNSVTIPQKNGYQGDAGAKGKAAAGSGKKTPAKGSKKDPKANSLTLPQRLHLCLICDNAESVENHNIFVEAAGELVKEHPGAADLLLLRRNVDVFELAHDLSVSGPGLKVGVLNGANRKMIGNHWFQTGARYAIDENIHRRSASLTRIALLLNMGTESGERRPTELQDTLKWLGGKVELATDTLNGNGPSKPGSRPPASGGGGGACFCCRRNRNTSDRKPADASKGSAPRKDDPKASSTAQGSATQKSQAAAGGSKASSTKQAKAKASS